MIPKPTHLSAKKAKKKAWDSFSLFIRARDGFICQFHLMIARRGMTAPCKCNGVLQACHLISRSKSGLLFAEDNVIAGCSGSNTWANYHQDEWRELWHAMYPDRVKKLEGLRGAVVQRKVSDYLNLATYYQREYERIIGRKAGGRKR